MMLWIRHGLVVVAVVWLSTVQADTFEDYVDPTFNCPATTTCRQVCVAVETDCPASMRCAANETLCADGSCSIACDPDLESPCAYDCASVACPKLVSDYDSCNVDYGPLYDQEAACGEEETASSTTYLKFNEPGFIAIYVWFAVLTTSILVWCAYNQRWNPVVGSSVPLAVETASSSVRPDCNAASAWQTGYKVHPIGTILHVATILTLLAIHALLAYLTIEYYIGQEAILSYRMEKRLFQDEEQLLLAFEILWVVGLFWSFSLKWPYSIRSLFLRRCRLDEATHVAVSVAPPEKKVNEEIYQVNYMGAMRQCCESFYRGVDATMAAIFSDVDQHGRQRGSKGDGLYKYCRVQRDGGDRYIVFLFRRYNLLVTENKEEFQEDGASSELEPELPRFAPGVWHVGTTITDIATAVDPAVGLTADQVEERRRVVGPNSIEMVEPSFWRCLFKEFTKAFYTYQTFMVWTWFPLWYYYMAIVWTIVIVTGAFTVSFFQYRNERSLYQISQITGTATVTRDGEAVTIPQDELVPGDVLNIEPGLAFCDMVVVASGNTVVDESALTGEATPMAKTAVDPTNDGNKEYHRMVHKRHTILAGTGVTESSGGRAIVMQTASYTARGELIREIYSYKRQSFKFDAEVPIVIAILFFYAIFGFAMTIYFTQDSPVYGWFYGMFVVGTTLPPLLPTVFTVSVGISDDRLARKGVACTQSESILVAGKVDRAFFDKTGTLTKQGLDFLSVRSASAWSEEGKMSDEMKIGMAVCHGLTLSKATGELVGNSVDVTMFQASAMFLGTTADNDISVRNTSGQDTVIKKQFDFDHHRMTQSVIVKDSKGSYTAFVKGSGESIRKLCKSESLPADFDAVVREGAKSGIYQICMARKPLPKDVDLSQVTRDSIESDLSFIGIINFKNVIREETGGVIRHLEAGQVKCVMVTGDSVLTGICIAKEAGILREEGNVLTAHLNEDGEVVWTDESDAEVALPSPDTLTMNATELAISGEAWVALRTNDPKEAARLLDFARVFGRCTPHDKVAVVSSSMELGFVTLMCGDGGNDCGALKTAHVGIALSDADASIVAPFTSTDKSIGSVVEVLKEGRCALASALASYKYMIIYGQIETINQLINAYFLITFTEWCWVFMDGIWTITLAFALPLARAAKDLAETRPTASLLGPQTMASVLGVLAINFLFTISGLGYLFSQDWFQCRKWSGQDISNVLVIGDNYESEVLFLITGYQYISSAMAFNYGYEFRQSWIRNYVFVALAALYTFLQFYITLQPSRLSCIWRVNCVNEDVVRSVTTFEPFAIQNPFNTTVMPAYFQRGLVGIMICNAIVICAYDYFVVNGIRRRVAARRLNKKKLGSPQSKEIV